MDYEVLDNETKLLLARDMLRGKESDHFRVGLTTEPGKEARQQALEADIVKIKAAIAELEESDAKPKAKARKPKAEDKRTGDDHQATPTP